MQSETLVQTAINSFPRVAQLQGWGLDLALLTLRAACFPLSLS